MSLSNGQVRHDSNNKTGGQIEDLESLSEALNSEVGVPQGYVQVTYRNWCLQHPELVVKVGNGSFKQGKNPSEDQGLLEAVLEATVGAFDDFIQSEENVMEEKEDEVAKKWKEVGNDHYKSKNLKLALESYTKSACHAKTDGESLALALANRSAALFQLGEYGSCLQDVGRSVEAGYPDKSLHKLYERKTRCLISLGKINAARDVLNNVKNHPSRHELHSLLEKRASNGLNSKEEPTEDPNGSKRKFGSVPVPNPAFPALASCVEVCYTAERGRHLRATRRISAGEMVCAEDATVAHPAKDAVGVLCQHCLTEVPNPVPSPISTKHVFCSSTCLEAAMSSYHPTEAHISAILAKYEFAIKMHFFTCSK